MTGACQGLEIKLDSDAIPFGSVMLGSKSSRKLVMLNTGDMGASFSWNVEQFAPHFTISPTKGYITPGMEVPFEITFAPTFVNADIRCDVSVISREKFRGEYCMVYPYGDAVHTKVNTIWRAVTVI